MAWLNTSLTQFQFSESPAQLFLSHVHLFFSFFFFRTLQNTSSLPQSLHLKGINVKVADYFWWPLRTAVIHTCCNASHPLKLFTLKVEDKIILLYSSVYSLLLHTYLKYHSNVSRHCCVLSTHLDQLDKVRSLCAITPWIGVRRRFEEGEKKKKTLQVEVVLESSLAYHTWLLSSTFWNGLSALHHSCWNPMNFPCMGSASSAVFGFARPTTCGGHFVTTVLLTAGPFPPVR